MTKDEYIAEWDSLVEQEKAIFDRRIKMNADFIEEHRKFKNGDKVEIVKKERVWLSRTIPEERTLAYVAGAKVYKGNISYLFMKAKKDGSVSKHVYSVYSFDHIELIESAKQVKEGE